MSQPIVRAQGVSKRYQLGRRQVARPTFRETIADAIRAPWQRLRRLSGRDESTTFWALDDISFDIHPGEAVGLIGRNGAGKSTLLKILSRITDPTHGRVELRGHVSSLLEVGTGFHSELSGRENIYLNGAILGMRKAEIERKFDAIVDFAEIERFLDTQVKHYSSGMYMRLAFAVAAHLEPDILLIDEVLAVGDAAFQKKCLGKMGEVAEGGRTVVFVSHHMASVTRLCQRAILLDGGKVELDGDVYDVTSRYLQSGAGTSAERHWLPESAPGDDVARLKSVRVLVDEQVSEHIDIRNPFVVEMEFWNHKPDAYLLAAFSFYDEHGVHLFVSADRFSRDVEPPPKSPGLFRARCVVPGNLLAEGQIRVFAEVSTCFPVYQIHFIEFDSVAFQVIDPGEPGSVRAGWGRPIPGVVRPHLEWETARIGPPLG